MYEKFLQDIMYLEKILSIQFLCITTRMKIS